LAGTIRPPEGHEVTLGDDHVNHHLSIGKGPVKLSQQTLEVLKTLDPCIRSRLTVSSIVRGDEVIQPIVLK
jgi:hypothetical protein